MIDTITKGDISDILVENGYDIEDAGEEGEEGD